MCVAGEGGEMCELDAWQQRVASASRGKGEGAEAFRASAWAHLKHGIELLKGGTQVRVLIPARAHDEVASIVAQCWLREAETIEHLHLNLEVGLAAIGAFPFGENLRKNPPPPHTHTFRHGRENAAPPRQSNPWPTLTGLKQAIPPT